MIDAYKALTRSAIRGVDPEVTFLMVGRRCCLSPGLMRSGLYPQKNSLLNRSEENHSSTGTQISSVQPGKTVDS